MYKVEKNIPIPRKNRNGKPSQTTFLLSLEVGDSFIFTVEKRRHAVKWYNLAKFSGLKVKIRHVEGDQYRIWRVK